jgi:hypothetical protein
MQRNCKEYEVMMTTITRRMLVRLMLGTIMAALVPAVKADSLLPRFRYEDLGTAFEYGNFPILMTDGTVYSFHDKPMGVLRRGEYVRGEEYEPGTSRTSKYVLKKDGSDVNLLDSIDPARNRFYDFTSNGRVVGLDIDPASPNKLNSFVFDSTTGEKTYLNKSPYGGFHQDVRGINDKGWLAGEGTGTGSTWNRAIFFASVDSQAVLLSSLVDDLGDIMLATPFGMNDRGEIVGISFDPSYQADYGYRDRVFKLIPIEPVPVPEPSTWVIIAAGCIWFARKRIGR